MSSSNKLELPLPLLLTNRLVAGKRVVVHIIQEGYYRGLEMLVSESWVLTVARQIKVLRNLVMNDEFVCEPVAFIAGIVMTTEKVIPCTVEMSLEDAEQLQLSRTKDTNKWSLQ